MTLTTERTSENFTKEPDFAILDVLIDMGKHGIKAVLDESYGPIDDPMIEALSRLAEKQCAVDEAHEKVRSYKGRNTSGRRRAVSEENAAGRERDTGIVNAYYLQDTPEERRKHDLEIISTRNLLNKIGGKALWYALSRSHEDSVNEDPWGDCDPQERAAGKYLEKD